jgi:hypothetical protein
VISGLRSGRRTGRHWLTGNSYPALVADGYTTDAGFELPRFDAATVEQMIADLQAVTPIPTGTPTPCPASTRWCGSPATRCWCSRSATTATRSPGWEADRVHPDRDGRYPVGAYLWPWHLTTSAASTLAGVAV